MQDYLSAECSSAQSQCTSDAITGTCYQDNAVAQQIWRGRVGFVIAIQCFS
jgi:hypothetical protein